MRPTAGDFESREGLKPYIERYVIHIADAYDDYRPPGPDTPARAGGAGAGRVPRRSHAVHLVFVPNAALTQTLPLQIGLIEAIEDAREPLAIAQFPEHARGLLASRTCWLIACFQDRLAI